MVVLSSDIYNSIVSDIVEYNGAHHLCEKMLVEKYPSVPKGTIGSIFGTQITNRMKINYGKFKSSKKCLNEYKKCVENKELPGIMLRLSTKYDVTPALLAKYILENTYTADETKAMKNDSTLIPDKHLAYEVFLCNLYDSDNGCIGTVIKRSIGIEYENRLTFELKKLNIPYEDETVLRNSGYDKTPDIKLTLPIAVDGFVINWIESKALFGDAESHSHYLKSQLNCYWNRFGPGMVIYWFGYLDVVEHTPENNKFIILRDRFPDEDRITKMNPNLLY